MDETTQPNATGNETGKFNETEFDTEFNPCSNGSVSCNSIFDDRYWRIRGVAQHESLAVLYALFLLASFGWNLFILVVMVKKRTTFKLPAHVAIFAITLANLFNCITVVLPVFLLQCTGEWVFFGVTDCSRCVVCKIQGAFVLLLVDFVLHVLALMSFDRMLLLLKPLTYKRYINKRRMFGMIIVLLVLCILIVTPPFYGFGDIAFNRNLGTCLPRFTGDEHGQIYYVAFGLIEGLLPILTLIVTSVMTYRVIGRALKTNHLRRKSLHKRKSEQEISEVHLHKGQQQQLAKVFGAFLLAYVFTYSPIIVVGFVFVFSSGDNDDKVPTQVFVFGFFCYLSNVLLQPILETLFISDLRTELRSVKSTIGESIRSGTDAVLKKGSEISHRISQLEFRSSLMEISTIDSPIPKNRSGSCASSPSPFEDYPLRRCHSDSGYEEGSANANGILVTYGSSRSLNRSQKRARFEFEPDPDSVKHTVVCLEPIPESQTLERHATMSPAFSSSSTDSLTEREGSAEPPNIMPATNMALEMDEDVPVSPPSTSGAVNFVHSTGSDPDSLSND